MFEKTNDGRYFFPKIEFYITNVCNLTCEHCNRFNDHDFRGWQKWSDYESCYQEWSRYVDFGHVTLLGGEPLLNPTVIDWILGINRIWKKPVHILTNGTRLEHVTGLYDTLLGDKSPYPEVQEVFRLSQQKNHVGISWHRSDGTHELDRLVKNFLGSPCVTNSEYGMVKYNNAFRVWHNQDSIYIAAWIQDEFEHSSIRRTTAGLTLHDNDVEQAHSACTFVQNRNYHFIRGALYKCGPVALMPEFDQQNPLLITEQQRAVLNSYQPMTATRLEQDLHHFLENIDQPIPQCRFCPVEKDMRRIYAGTKKNRSIPIINIAS